MLVLEGEVEFTFENEEKTVVKSGECFCAAETLDASLHLQKDDRRH